MSKSTKAAKPNTKSTVYSERYPNLWNHVNNYLTDNCGTKAAKINQDAKMSELMKEDDFDEFVSNVELTIGANVAALDFSIAKLSSVLNAATAAISFKDI